MKPAYRELPTDWLTVAEAALTLQVTSQAVYRALGAGRLPFRMIEGRKCVKREGLTAAFWGTSQRRDPRAVQASVQTLDEDPPRPMAQLMAGLAAPAPPWQRIAQLANAGLDCAAWGPPPWPADRWATLAMVLSLAEEAAAE
jgi:excisionase family DNA binding protein